METRAQILSLLVEGTSISSAVRLTSVSKPTIIRLIKDMGRVSAKFQGRVLRDLPCQRIEVDEIWAYVGMKPQNVPPDRRDEAIGVIWTFTSICADTKLVPTWYVGRRDATTTRKFLVDLARRMRFRIQLTSDGASFYKQVAWDAFAGLVDYAQLQRQFGHRPVETSIDPIYGYPDPSHVSTSYVERQNLTMRMSMRRFTRLTNAYSKKSYNLSCAVATYFAHYNFARPHATLTKRANGKPTTPAMAAGVSSWVWEMADLVRLLEDTEPTARDVTARRFDKDTGYRGRCPD